jgi:osmotically-inducible protein OsmY
MNLKTNKIIVGVLSAAMTALAYQAGSLQAAQPKSTITDDGITSAIETDLLFAKGVSVDSIDVTTSNGVVTLSGTVDNLLSHDRAIRIVESLRGVRAVVDRLVVIPVSRPDEDIRKDVLTALLQDPATESYQVAASVNDAVVTLTGSVGSWAEMQLAGRVARGVKGVKEVHNNIAINYMAKRTDQEIAADVKAALQWDIWLNGELIDVHVNGGKVWLTGTVGSAIGKSRAVADAWPNGVTGVDDTGLTVEPWARDASRRKRHFVLKTDDEIEHAVQAAFHADPRVTVFSQDINVRVEDSVVILTGSVRNLKAKAAAEHDARDTVGVWWVDNLLKVRPQNAPSAADMQKSLNAALLWDPLLDGTTVEAAVINHVAYLSGSVDYDCQKAEAQDVAMRTKGVVEVRNHLKIEPEVLVSYYDWPYGVSELYSPQPPKSDEQIKKDIERAFFWSPLVDRDDITLTVNNGVAILTGTVDGWLAYGEAYRDAYKGGASSVIISGLKVKKGAWF